MIHKCPDRCDMEFTYDWNHTNLSYDFMIGNPKYLLNAGDSISVALKNAKPDSVYVLNGENKLELTNDGNNVWSGKIPKTWNVRSTFNVIFQKGSCRMLLWEGLLNANVNEANCSFGNAVDPTLLPDSFIKIGSDGVEVSRDEDGNFVIKFGKGFIHSDDKSITVTEDSGTYDLASVANVEAIEESDVTFQ